MTGNLPPTPHGDAVKDRYADAVMNTFGPPRLVLTRGGPKVFITASA